MRGACRLRQFWRFNLILTHCGFLGRASAKQSEISENSEHSDGLADARTMVCRSWLTAYPPWRRWGVVWSGTACHRLRGGNYICVLGAPGMSPTPRSAKYPATHSCHRLRGGGNARLLSSSPPTAEGRRCAAPIERQRATPSVSEADATTPPMVRASTSNPEGSECSEISDYGNYALRQRAAPSAATPPLCFLGRTFGTHSLYIALISVAARCANRQPPPLLFTLIHSSSQNCVFILIFLSFALSFDKIGGTSAMQKKIFSLFFCNCVRFALSLCSQ